MDTTPLPAGATRPAPKPAPRPVQRKLRVFRFDDGRVLLRWGAEVETLTPVQVRALIAELEG